jgi:predicted DsbA family dithiol-disulfide isomerase
MKKLVSFCVVLLTAAVVLAADTPPVPVKLDAKLDRMIRDALPVCSDSAVSYQAMVHKLPANFTGTVVVIDSKRCAGQFLNVVSKEGGFYLGVPWFLDDEKSGTIEQKLKEFTWSKLQSNFTPVVDRTKTRDGLYKVTLLQTTESGNLPLEGEIDPAGTIFFVGHFKPLNEDVRTSRLKVFEPFLALSPSTGAAKPAVTVVEFSDFECPSCQHASTFMKPILERHGDKVRYVRYDLPLVANHPWALAAALGGRAVHNQKPELFWEYKKQVYENQDKLNAFLIEDFARNFAKDHDLDMQKYDADVNSPALKESLMKGIGTAFANDIRATPTYMVNGTLVDPGEAGKALEAYVASLLK